MTGSSVLDQLTGDAQTFVEKVWASRVHHHRVEPAELAAYLSLEDADHLLTSTAIRTPSVRLVRDGSVLPESSYTRPATLAGRSLTGLVDARKALALFEDGATVVFQGLHRYWPPLTQLIAELELDLGHPCQANAYLTPVGAQGFAVHKDTHDVFVLQTAGRKQWEVHGQDGVEEPVFEPGHVMYMPTGTPHAARTQDTISLHITIGINQLTWRGLVTRAISALAAKVPDDHLPAGYLGDPQELAHQLGRYLHDVADELRAVDPAVAVEDEVRRFLTQRPPRLPGGLTDVIDLGALTDETPLRRRRGHPCVLLHRGDTLEMLLGDRSLTLPAWLWPALEEIRTRSELSPADLPLDEQSRLVLCRRLVREGLLEVLRCSFRCAAASLARAEGIAGTASTVRAFLLLENAGPWGEDALRDARLPDGLGDELTARAAAARVRVLLIRRPGRQRPTDRLRVFAAYAHHAESWIETTVLSDIHQVHDLDVEALGAGRSAGLTPHRDPVFAVCTHGRHDTCCAERGRPVAAALAAAHPDLTWEVSHIGGDRFAANALVLPHGLYYGRLEADSVVAVADAHLDGRLSLEHLRGRSGLGTALQFAELALRRHLGEPEIDRVRFVSRTQKDGTVAAFFAVGGQTYAVRVRSTRSEDLHRLTCSATRDNASVQHELLDLSLVHP